MIPQIVVVCDRDGAISNVRLRAVRGDVPLAQILALRVPQDAVPDGVCNAEVALTWCEQHGWTVVQ